MNRLSLRITQTPCRVPGRCRVRHPTRGKARRPERGEMSESRRAGAYGRIGAMPSKAARSSARWVWHRCQILVRVSQRWRQCPSRLGWLVVVIVACAASADATPAAASSPLTWATPVPADDQPPFAYLTANTGVSCPSTGLCVAVDGAGDVLTATDPAGGPGAWARAASVATYFGAVSCPSSELCVAVGGASIATSTDPAGGAGAWTVTKVLPGNSEYGGGGGGGLAGVSCPSVSLCVATDSRGDVLSSTDPTGGASAWSMAALESPYGLLGGVSCPSTRLCVLVAAEGEIATSTDPTGGTSAWTLTKVDGTPGEVPQLLDVSCSSETLCVATDNYNDVLTSTDPAGGANAWQTVKPSKGQGTINHVTCITGLCVGVTGEGVITSTDPTGGASAWTATPIDRPNRYGGQESIEAVSCATTGLCVLGDSGSAVITATEPTGATSAWTLSTLEVGISALEGASCVSEGLCVAVDNAGNVVASTDPTAAPGTWTSAHVDGTGGLTGVSCPSMGLCVAVDDAGDVVTSSEPTGGAGAWHVADIDGTHALRRVSCPSVRLCVAIDEEGDVLTSTDPTGGAGAWSLVRLYPDLTDVSCPSEHLCVLSAKEGYIITSTEPAAGAASWSLKYVQANEEISCPSLSLCVTVNSGLVPLATVGDPMSEASPWATTYVKGINGFQVVSCAQGGMCVATGEDGGNGTPGTVAVSAEPAGGPPAWVASNVYGMPIEPPGHGLQDGTPEMPGVSCVAEGMCVVVDTKGLVMVGTPTPHTAPVNTSPPLASGTLAPGQTLACAEGSWTGYPSPAFSYEWLRDGTPIAGASTSAYVVQAADEGHGLSCQVTASNSSGSETATSNTLQVPPAPALGGGGSGGSGGSSGGPGGDNPSTPTGTVSSAFVLNGVDRVARHGAVKLTLTLPGPGTLQIVGRTNAAQPAGASPTSKSSKATLVVVRLRLTVSEAGRIVVTLVPTTSAKVLLSRRGKLKATFTITYTPKGGAPRSIARTITFKSKRR
jgi:hypothetical protein